MAWNIEGMLNHITLVRNHINEHGFEPFQELAQRDPEAAIKELPRFIDKALKVGNSFFSGMMCGGPAPEATAPFLDVIGAIYPSLSPILRGAALERVLNFLDGLNYFNSQNNVALIHEPWLVRDILVNRRLYWPGFNQYTDELKEVEGWADFDVRFFVDQEEGKILSVPSTAMLSYSLGRVDVGYDLPIVRNTFAEAFPDVVDRTKDFAAALICDGAHYNFKIQPSDEERTLFHRPPSTYEQEVRASLEEYAPEWRDDLECKIDDRKWIWLPRRIEELGLTE